MITILIKRKDGSIYQASSFNSKLEKEIISGSDVNKKLAKEFEIKPEQIHKFWTDNNEKTNNNKKSK